MGWGSNSEWIISSFGEPWRFWLVPIWECAEQPGPSRIDLVGREDPIGALLYSGFDDSGAVSDEIALPLLKIYDALTDRDVLGTLEDPYRPTVDPRRLLRGFERVLAEAIYDAVELGRLRFERVASSPWPFPDAQDSSPVLGPESVVEDRTTFIALRIVDQDGRAMRARRVRIESSRDTEKQSMTDASGRLRVGNLASGTCKVTILDVDHRDVQSPSASPAKSETVPGIQCTVRQGDTTASIAIAAGFLWSDTVWSAPENKDLRNRRPDPNVLLPGDVLHVPDRIPPLFSLPTGAEHTIVVRVSKLKIRLRLLDWLGKPRASEACQVSYAGQDDESVATDGDGMLSFDVPATVRTASIRCSAGDEFVLSVGALNPVDTLTGVGARLRNLGFHGASEDATLEDRMRLRFGVELFADVAQAKPDNNANQGFADRIRKEYGL